ncbi:MAG: hypothetical protein Q9166_007220 [cf. Caloplaca sp. 2 TL-2023]
MKSKTLLNDDPFYNEDTLRLFEAIDELRSCGITGEIDLPELVIVGDQSAGKSSLLQSLTEIPFPVADRLCTRFPTRIVSRRATNDEEITKISIQPVLFDNIGPFALKETPDERAKRLEAYKNFAYSKSDITLDEFKEAVDRAKELMQIVRTVPTELGVRTFGERNFARDILKVEISGPGRSHFSILDVPGVFQSLTRGLTDVEKVGVRDMVASFMMPKESIIICVASGTNDLANQAAFDMASKHDQKLERTVGVITKCDITQHKDYIVSLAQNEEKRLKHGWFVVRNRTPSEVDEDISPSERNHRETEFFDQAPWTELPGSQRGTQALKKFLADLLCQRNKKTFPSILTTIRSRREATLKELQAMGAPRDTTDDKRAYLTGIAQRFYNLTSQALDGKYQSGHDNLKIRRNVREAKDAFASNMTKNGHCAPFQSNSNPSTLATPTGVGSDGSLFRGFGSQIENPIVGPRPPSTIGVELHHGREKEGRETIDFQNIYATKPYMNFSPEETRLSDYSQGVREVRTTGRFGNINSSADTPFQTGPSAFNQFASTQSSMDPVSGPQSGLFTQSSGQGTSNLFKAPNERSSLIYTWIREEIKNCRGIELQGTLNPDVLPALFHRQIASWRDISTSHFQSVTKTTMGSLEQAANAVCSEENTRRKIRSLIQETNKVAESRGLLQIRQRVDDIVSRHLQTQNPYFERNIRGARLARFKAALDRYRSRTPSAIRQDGNASGEDRQHQIVLDLRDAESLFDEIHISNAQNLEDEIHDTLRSYYKLALQDFIEFVTQQVVESYLNDPNGPVLFFNPTYISALDRESIEDLGAEDPNIATMRMRKDEMLGRLDRASKIVLKYT